MVTSTSSSHRRSSCDLVIITSGFVGVLLAFLAEVNRCMYCARRPKCPPHTGRVTEPRPAVDVGPIASADAMCFWLD